MIKSALEFRRALQLFAFTLDEKQMIEVPSVFPAYQVGKAYKTKDVFSYGINSVGDPQLYQVIQDHISAEYWYPDTSTSLYKKIGIASSGYPEWTQPLGESDAYHKDDIISYNDVLYRSVIDNNVWSPEVYPDGWVAYQGE